MDDEPCQPVNAVALPSKGSDMNSGTAVFHRSLLTPPDCVSHASGITLHLDDGRSVIDACGGAAVACLGHGNQEVIAAAAKQMSEISYVHTGAYTTGSAEALAHELLDGNPYGLEKAIFVGSGSEAMDGALKLARQYFYEQSPSTERIHFIARRQAWHGTTLGSISISSNLPRKIPYKPLLLPHVSHVSPAYAYQYQKTNETTNEFVQRLAKELDDEFVRVGPEKVIAFVAEPVVGATSGCVAAPPGYFVAIREVCDKYGALLILDEVMCGVGRTGTFFAFEHEDVVPDIMTIGKGLGGGYAPIAAVLASHKVVDVLRRGTAMFNHGHTYQAHPLTCAIALKVQQILKRERLVQKCKYMGRILERELRKHFEGARYVGDIRGRGLFWAVEFVRDKESKASFDPELGFGSKVQQRAFELGVAIYPGMATVDGYKGDHILLAPPYTVSEEELGEITKVMRKAYDIEATLFDDGLPSTETNEATTKIATT